MIPVASVVKRIWLLASTETTMASATEVAR